MSNILFLTKAAILDQFIDLSDPQKDSIGSKVVIEVITSDAALNRYFFTKSPHPSWIPVLWGSGFFQNLLKLAQVLRNGLSYAYG